MRIDLQIDMADFDLQMQKIREQLALSYDEELAIWRKAADPVVREIRALVPVGKKTKHLYNGKGEKVASFPPGTLRDSIMVHPKYTNAVVVTSYTRGYNSYAMDYVMHFFMLEYGFSPRGGSTFVAGFGFMRRGAINATPYVLRIMVDGYAGLIEKYIKKSGGS